MKNNQDTSEGIIDSTEFSIKEFDETLKAIHIILKKIRADNTNKAVHTIFEEKRTDNTNKAIGSSDIERMMVYGQSLKGGVCLIEDLLELLNEEPQDTEKIQLLTNSLLYLLARILAVSMGILDFDKLYEGIALSVIFTKCRYKGPVDERAFAILNSEEIIKEKYEKEKNKKFSE